MTDSEDAELIPAAKALCSEFSDFGPWDELSESDKHFFLRCVERVRNNLPKLG